MWPFFVALKVQALGAFVLVAEVVAAPTEEAIGTEAVEATVTPVQDDGKGTPADGATVQPDETGATPTEEAPSTPADDEPVYTTRTLTAKVEEAQRETREATIREQSESVAASRKKLNAAVSETDGARAPVIRWVQDELKKLSSDLDDDDMAPVLKAVGRARDIIEDAAFGVVGESYRAAIDATFTPAESKAFWEQAASLDPALDVSVVLPLFADLKALSSKAISTADPELLIKANPKLSAYVDEVKAKAKTEGRDQGRKDPPGEPGAAGRAVNSNAYKTKSDWRGAHTRREITSQQMKEINADPSIPEGL